ncbi:MAG TPA: hypothetical protein VF310_12340, partial [Vicinamibacteria bacterium]
WGYLTLALHHALAPLLLLAFAGALVAWARHPRHLLTGATLPFVAAHFLIAHKELRFLLPAAVLAPLLLVMAAWRGDGWPRPLRSPAGRVAAGALLALDLAALAAFTLVPNRAEVRFQRFAYRLWPDRFEAVLLGETPSPWRDAGLPMHFYQPRELALSTAADLGALPARRHLVIAGAFDQPASPELACEALYRSFPGWMENAGPTRRLRGWSLHRCRPSR